MSKEIFYEWGGLNTTLFHTINDLHSVGTYEQIMLYATLLAEHHNFLFYLGIITAIAVMVIWHKRNRELPTRKGTMRLWIGVIAVFAGSYMVDGALVKGFKLWLQFPRPFKVLPEGSVHLIGPMMEADKYYASFPSGHASFAMVLVASLWPVLGNVQRTLGIAFVLLVMFSRIALGVHFPADVIGGALLALLVVIIVRFVWSWAYIQKKVSNGIDILLRSEKK